MDEHSSAVTSASLPSVLHAPILLRVLGTSRHGQIVELSAARVTIGSGDRCNLRLRAAGIRPQQCLIMREATETRICSLAPDTLLNGHPFRDAVLRPGDTLQIGPIGLEVISAGLPPEFDLPSPEENGCPKSEVLPGSDAPAAGAETTAASEPLAAEEIEPAAAASVSETAEPAPSAAVAGVPPHLCAPERDSGSPIWHGAASSPDQLLDRIAKIEKVLEDFERRVQVQPAESLALADQASDETALVDGDSDDISSAPAPSPEWLELQAELDAQRREQEQTQERVAQAEQDIEALQVCCDDIMRARHAAEEELRGLQASVDCQLVQQNASLESWATGFESRQTELNEVLALVRSELEAIAAQCAAAVQERSELRVELNELRSQLDELKKKQESSTFAPRERDPDVDPSPHPEPVRQPEPTIPRKSLLGASSPPEGSTAAAATPGSTPSILPSSWPEVSAESAERRRQQLARLTEQFTTSAAVPGPASSPSPESPAASVPSHEEPNVAPDATDSCLESGELDLSLESSSEAAGASVELPFAEDTNRSTAAEVSSALDQLVRNPDEGRDDAASEPVPAREPEEPSSQAFAAELTRDAAWTSPAAEEEPLRNGAPFGPDSERTADSLSSPAEMNQTEHQESPAEDDAATDAIARLARAGIWKDGDSTSGETEPATAQDETAAPEAAAASAATPAGSEEDDSIENYMRRLLERVRGDSETTTASPLGRTARELVASESSEVEEEESEEAAADPQMLSESDFQPRSQAPEMNANLAAMRALANDSRRKSILTHAQRTWTDKAQTKFIGAACGAAVSVGSFFFLDTDPELAAVGFFGGAAAAGICIWQAFRMRRQLFATLRLPATESAAESAANAQDS